MKGTMDLKKMRNAPSMKGIFDTAKLMIGRGEARRLERRHVSVNPKNWAHVGNSCGRSFSERLRR